VLLREGGDRLEELALLGAAATGVLRREVDQTDRRLELDEALAELLADVVREEFGHASEDAEEGLAGGRGFCRMARVRRSAAGLGA
jgi:hypothetical protein